MLKVEKAVSTTGYQTWDSLFCGVLQPEFTDIAAALLSVLVSNESI
jgi:hypothetical protein